MDDSFDAVIIGAGIVGAACACECAAAGLSVCVVERDVAGSGATAAGMGHIVVMDDSPAQVALTAYSQTLWDALVRSAPEQHDYMRCGTVWIAADAVEMEAVGRKYATLAASGIAAEVLDARALYTLEPHVRPGLAGGLLVPGDAVVYPPRSAAYLLRQAEAEGTHWINGQAIRLLPHEVVLDGGARVRGEVVVLACGAHSIDLVPELPVRAKKGHLAITDRCPGVIRHQLVEMGYVASAHAPDGDSVAFNVQPRPTGQVLIGSSRQFDVHDDTVDQVLLARMLKRALDYLPALAGLSCIRVWTGLRAATPDGLPLIGPHPARRGLWLATGHEGLGITTALGTARLLVAQLLQRPSDIPVEPYLPSRLLGEAAHA